MVHNISVRIFLGALDASFAKEGHAPGNEGRALTYGEFRSIAASAALAFLQENIDPAIQRAAWDHESLMEAKTMSEQANAVIALKGAMVDLETWHTQYDYETGEISSGEDEDGD